MRVGFLLQAPVGDNGLKASGRVLDVVAERSAMATADAATEKPARRAAPAAAPVLRIGVISDTHGLLRPEAIHQLAGVDHIIHAGDIGRPEVIAELRKIAPTTAIRGNIDQGAWAAAYPATARLELAGRSIFVLHNLKELDLDPAAAAIDVVVSGHSHQPKIETVGSVIYLNPGSAGPRRFTLPIALATLELSRDAVRPCLHEIA